MVIGTSAGGLEALRIIAAGLPADFATPVCIVMHTSPQSPGILHDILSRSGAVPAVTPRSGERLQPGRIYVAPPDYHLILEPGTLRITKGPRENRFRPAIDPLFRSAAQVYGPRAIGVVLTGNLGDGAAGLWTIQQLGGTTIVQDPHDALFPSMPLNALEYVNADHVVRLAEIAPLLVRLTSTPAEEAPVTVPDALEVEVAIAKERNAIDAGVEGLGAPSSYACPECHGVLLEIKEGSHIRFRCHTGHAYSVESLVAEVREAAETSLWTAVRSLEEGGMLMERMAAHVRAQHGGEAGVLLEHAREAHRRANLVRELVATPETVTTDTKR